MGWIRKLREGRIWQRIAVERLSEPLHLNAAALAVALFGSFRAKVAFDLVLRQHHAWALLHSADRARSAGITELTALEFGVASGAGLLNMCRISDAVERETGVRCRIVGFDTGQGMPPPVDFRDHPELYQAGDFPMDATALSQRLPPRGSLALGPIGETLREFMKTLRPSVPIGFVSLDVDYYSSAKDALCVFDGPGDCYLPAVPMYVDDLALETHNSWAGELLAIREYNEASQSRKIERPRFLRASRLFKNAAWIDHMYMVHVLDHPVRVSLESRRPPASLPNPLL